MVTVLSLVPLYVIIRILPWRQVGLFEAVTAGLRKGTNRQSLPPPATQRNWKIHVFSFATCESSSIFVLWLFITTSQHSIFGIAAPWVLNDDREDPLFLPPRRLDDVQFVFFDLCSLRIGTRESRIRGRTTGRTLEHLRSPGQSPIA